MKFKIDENLPVEAALALREHGFDAQTVGEEGLAGATDGAVSACAKAESRVLITLDMDFANIRAYPPEEHAGIVGFRLKAQDKATIVA